MRKVHDITKVQIQNYELFVGKTIDNEEVGKISRVVVYKHESIVGKLRHDLMDNSVDSVWLEVGFKYHKKILIGGH